ncbi:MAG: peptidylprolyl isomerase [Clostridia bacterium]|nr:peptidylprolyl isomerase [Clostridia bacterium]
MEGNNRTLAVVAGVPIRQSDVEEAILAMGARGRNYDNPQGRAAVLDQLINQRLFLADAKKTMLEYDPAFKQQLAKVKDDLLFQFAVSRALERVNVTEEEIRAFYDANPDQFAGQKQVTASHILVEDRAQAEELLKKIQSGELAFEDAARQFSTCPSAANGGSLGEFGRGQMVPEFDEACFSMEPGELRGPVQTQFGYHLIRLDGVKDGQPVPFDQAREAIREHLLAEKGQKAFQTRVNQLKLMYPVDR